MPVTQLSGTASEHNSYDNYELSGTSMPRRTLMLPTGMKHYLLVMTSNLSSKERPTKPRQNMKFCFKLSQTLGKSPFQGWKQLSNSLKS